jgi:hypothetical protein
MKKKDWGNAVWYLFHTLAEKLKPEFVSELPVLFSQISGICNNLPCPDCQQHATQIILRSNAAHITSSKENLINYLWSFHNSVNKRTGAAEFTKESLDMYKKAITQNVVQHFINIMNENLRSERAMLYTFHRQKFIKGFKQYISENANKYNS